MLKRSCLIIILAVCCAAASAVALGDEGSREFRVGGGGTLVLDLDAGATVEITGGGGSTVSVEYEKSCTPDCEIEFAERGGNLEIRTEFVGRQNERSSNITLRIRVPRQFDVELDSMGGGLTIDGVDGTFRGETMGGELVLRDVRGEAKLKTMGGEIRLTDSELDGYLKTMGGKVLFENVVGDVKGESMGGNVRYKNVRRRDGGLGSPPRLGDDMPDAGSADTVQISTMGGTIEIEDAPDGADLHTMGGNIEIRDAQRFVRAKTMGGDIDIDAVDGWVRATTMGGDIDVTLVGSGGDVQLTSMSGDIDLVVPSGFGMDLDLEIAFTRNSSQDFEIDAPGDLRSTVSPDWDHGHGTPRKYIRSSGSVNGGGNSVKIETVNGNITIRERR